MKTNRYRITVLSIMLSFILFSTTVWSMDPPIIYWNMDESEGDIANDVMGDFPGTWVGTTRWQPENGKFGGAMEAEDDSSFIIVEGSDGIFDDLGTEFTVSVWVQVYEFTQTWHGIIFKNNAFFLESNNSSSSGTVNSIHFKAKDADGSQPFNLYGDILIDDGEWHHVVGIYNNDIAQLYIDNELDKEGDATGMPIGYVEDPLIIGAKFENTYRNSWNGLIDDVRIYDYALSEVQVDSLYNMEIASKVNRYSTPVSTFHLEQNYPNPFNPETRIEFSIPRNDVVTVEILDLLGRTVQTLVSEELAAGRHAYTWHAVDQASGIYFYRVTTSDFSQMRKMLLVK